MRYKHKGALELYQKPFVEYLPNLVTSMDVDTTRFMEYIWAYRAAHGFNTGAFVYNIAGSHQMKIDSISKLFTEEGLTCQFQSNIVWRSLIPEPSDPRVPRLFISLTQYNSSEPYSVVITGNPEMVKHWENFFLDKFQAPTIKKVAILTGVAKDGNFRISHRTLQEETSDLGHDTFYPFIEGGLKKLAQEFKEAPECIMLLIGQWGTGKSTLIRSLMMLIDFENFGICNNQLALESPEISDWLNSFDNNSMVALEDADMYIKSREDGNAQMSSLLNIADGVIKAKRKLIISTNLSSVNSVDEALIRPGRTFKVIQFRKLTINEANAARASIGLDPILQDPNEEPDIHSLTLAEALNFERGHNVTTMPMKVVGFGTGR